VFQNSADLVHRQGREEIRFGANAHRFLVTPKAAKTEKIGNGECTGMGKSDPVTEIAVRNIVEPLNNIGGGSGGGP
jgi:hypothetical protein